MAPVEENNEEPDNIPGLLIQLRNIVVRITDSNLRVACL